MNRALLTAAIVLAACDDSVPGFCKVDSDCPTPGSVCYRGVSPGGTGLCTARPDAGPDDGSVLQPADGGEPDGGSDGGSDVGSDGGSDDAGHATTCLVDSACRLDEHCVSGICTHFEPLCSGTVGFPGALRTSLSLSPRAFAVGLLDGDSKLDLVVADAASNTAQVLPGKGDGTFGSPINLTLVTAPSAVVVSDLTGDGISDLAVTSDVDGTVSVLQGRGDGTFTLNASYPVGAHPSAVAAVRFNADVNDDLLVASDNGIDLLINRGDGKLNSPVRKGLGGKVTHFVAADITADNKLDVAAAVGSSVWIVPGDGTASFGAGTSYALASAPLGLQAGDFTRMHDVDVVAATAGGLLVLQNGGENTTGANGTSFTVKTLTSGVSLSSLVSFDYNDDGYIEFGQLETSGDLTMLAVSAGPARYSTPSPYRAARLSAASEGTQAHVADVDHNGALDVLLPNLLGKSVEVALNPLPKPLTDQIGDAFALAIQDMNLDGKPDYVAIGKGSSIVRVMLGVGGGSFVAGGRSSSGDPVAVHTGDFNGDQNPDVAVLDSYDSESGKVKIFLGDGKGNLTDVGYFLPGSGGPSSYGTLASGDFDGDGSPDLAVASSGKVMALFGKGDGTFPDAVEVPRMGSQAAAVADLDADGLADIASIGLGDTVDVSLGARSRAFSSIRSFQAGGNAVAVGLADVDRDSKPDIVVAVNPWGKSGSQVGIAVLLNVGAGLFGAPSFFETPTPPESLAIGDINGDRIPDLAVLADVSRTFYLLMGRGDGTFAKPVTNSAAPYEGLHVGHAWITIGDLNGDLLPDVAVVGPPGIARFAHCLR